MPLCTQCLTEVLFEVYECQQVCPNCGAIESSEYLTTDFQFQALEDVAHYTSGKLPLHVKPYSVYQSTDYYSTQRKSIIAYLRQCAKVFELEQFIPTALDLFSMIIPEKQTVEDSPKLRWGTKAKATAIACCLLASRIHGKYTSVREVSIKLNVDPYNIGRHLSEVTSVLAQSGNLVFQQNMGQNLTSATQKWIAFLSSPSEQPMLPSQVWIDATTLPKVEKTVQVLSGMAESVFEGQLVDPTALSIVVIALEVTARRYLDVLPVAVACRMAPTTLLQRQRDWHFLFYRLSRQLPWGKDIRRTNFACFLYQIVELLDHGVAFVDAGLPLSYLKAKKTTQNIKERVDRALTRLSAASQPYPNLATGELDNLDAAIESLLVLGEPRESLEQATPANLLAMYHEKRHSGAAFFQDLNSFTLTELDLTPEEEALYLAQHDWHTTDELELRNNVGHVVNNWPT